jgi:hypothetical protein
MSVNGRFLLELVVLAGFSQTVWSQSQPSAAEIIRRSVATNTADWKAQLLYAHREADTKSTIDASGRATIHSSKTYDVMMIEGSPYNRVIAINNEPLAPKQAQQEEKKLHAEIQKRHSESATEREQRLSAFRSERSEEHLLMEQMAKAFLFKLVGEEKIGNVDCYVLDAAPDPNYNPPVQKARVLSGMKGKMWIEKTQFHWAKVQAEVIHPVEFALFVAKVKPGTSFELQQSPVGNVWLPCQFIENVNASVLGVYSMRTREQERYFDYRPNGFIKDKANLSSLRD